MNIQTASAQRTSEHSRHLLKTIAEIINSLRSDRKGDVTYIMHTSLTDRLTVSGNLPDCRFAYDIVWSDSFDSLYEHMQRVPDLCPGRICIVTDSHVGELYLTAVRNALKDFPGQIEEWVFPAGEESKTIDTVCGLYRFLIEKRFDRRDLLLALGGGVTGDLTGFAAATYLRGIDFVQVPASLLAQVDSSVGGKTGVDMTGYKNMVGAFHQPRLVYMNMSVLRSLPDDQFASGMGEVVKTAVLGDASLYQMLREKRDEVLARDPAVLSEVIFACCRVKASVVAQDPSEKGLRALLNLGHTLGHAVEKCKNFSLLHGHCVAIGLEAAVFLAEERGVITAEDGADIRQLLLAYGLPVSTGGITPEELVNAAKSDKKMIGGKIRFILPEAIGRAVIDDSVSEEELLRAACHILDT